MFDWLRRKPASSQIIEDVVFGKLERAAGRTDLEAEVELAETGEVVTVWVEAAGNPTDAQRNLFLEFCRRYPTLRARLESALRGYRPDYPADMGFVLATLSLSADGKELSLQFTPSVEDGDMAFFVDLREWEILGVQGVD